MIRKFNAPQLEKYTQGNDLLSQMGKLKEKWAEGKKTKQNKKHYAQAFKLKIKMGLFEASNLYFSIDLTIKISVFKH